MRIYKTLMNKTFIYLLIAVLAACKSTPYSDETTKSDLRAPAYPLLTLHPHVKLWSMTDELNKQNMTFGGSTQLPFVGFLRVDGAMYRFMGSKELPMQAIAPMALDHEKWEGKFTSLVPDEGWEQPDFDDKYWQLSEGAFGTPGMWEARTQWTSSNIWVRREVEVDPYLLEHKKDFDAAVSKDSVDRKIYDDLFPLIVNDCNEIIFHDKVNALQLLDTYKTSVTQSGIAGQDYLLDIVEFTRAFLSGDLKKALKMYDRKFSRLDHDARFDVTLQLNGMLIRKGDAKMCERGLELIERTMKDCGWSEDNPLFAAVVSGLKDKFKDNKDE